MGGLGGGSRFWRGLGLKGGLPLVIVGKELGLVEIAKSKKGVADALEHEPVVGDEDNGACEFEESLF